MKHFRTSLLVLIFWTLVAGGIYPLLVTGIGAAFFPKKAAGSLTTRDGRVVGSALIGQDFTGSGNFHPRPSAVKYDASSSGASNLGYTSKDLKDAYEQRKVQWEKENGPAEAPVDMLFASGSGLDPHISIAAAMYQVPRVARLRGISREEAAEIVRENTQRRFMGVIGEPVVNVLQLNMALDKYKR